MAYEPKTKLASANMAGNLHDVKAYCNKFGLSDFLVEASVTSGSCTVMLFRLPLWWECDQFGPKPAADQPKEN